MRVRMMSFLAVLSLAVLPVQARCADEEKTKPTLVVRIQSIDDVMADVNYLLNLAGREEEAKQIDGLIKSQLGEKGLVGIDTKRPLGLYATMTADLVSSNGIVMIPIADEKAFLGLLENFEQKPEKGEDGIYSISPDGIPFIDRIYFTFHNKYLYATLRDKAELAKDKLVDPEKMLSQAGKGTVGAIFRIDQVPEGFKQIAIGQVELILANLKEQKVPNETEAQRKLKEMAVDKVTSVVKAVLTEGGDFGFSLNVDRKSGEISTEISMSGVKDTELATYVADLKKAKSLFAGIITEDAASNFLVNWSLPKDMREALAPVIDEVIKKALENEKDETKRKEGEKALKALEPTFKAGILDAAYNMTGPNKHHHYTLVGGAKIKEGDHVDKVLRELVKMMPERDRAKIKLDAEVAGNHTIHRVDAQKDIDENTRKMFGEGPIYFASRHNAFLFSMGPDGLKAIKHALTAEAKEASSLQFETSVARLVPLMIQTKEKDDVEKIKKAAMEAFGSDSQKNDTIRFTLEGGKALKGTIVMKAQVIQFFGKAFGDAIKLEETRTKGEKEKADK